MKQLMITLTLFVFLQDGFIFSQVEKGNKELSVAASYMNRKFEDDDEKHRYCNFVGGVSRKYYLWNSPLWAAYGYERCASGQ